MKNVISALTVLEDVTLVSIYNIEPGTSHIVAILEDIANAGICIDMISQSPPMGGRVSLSFTLPDENINKLLTTVAKHRKAHPELRTEINSQNTKISLYGEPMKWTCGVAANIFSLVAETGSEIKLITTSEVDISLLMDKDSAKEAVRIFERYFGITHTNSL